MKRLIVLISLLCLSHQTLAQAQPEPSFEELFNKLLKQFDDQMDKEMKRFEKFFDTHTFQGLDKMLPQFGSPNPGAEPFWRETPNERILVFKVETTNQGIPFNIKIKDGSITVTGTVQKQQKSIDPTTGSSSFSSNTYQFQHGPMILPKDIDPEGVKIENKNGEVLIRFPKKKPASVSSPKQSRPLPRSKKDRPI